MVEQRELQVRQGAQEGSGHQKYLSKVTNPLFHEIVINLDDNNGSCCFI